MSKTRNSKPQGGGRDRRISVRAVRRDPPDLRKLSRAVIELAMAQANAEAEAVAATADQDSTDQKPKAGDANRKDRRARG